MTFFTRALATLASSLLLCLLLTHPLAAQQGITFETAFPELTFEFPVEIQTATDGSDRLFVVEQPGRIKVFPADQAVSSAQTFLDIRDIVSFSSGQEIGLLGLAFHPRYRQNGYFYVYHTRRSNVSGIGVELVLARYTVSGSNSNRADPASRLEIFSFDKNQNNSNHNGGKIAFGPDGYLYASLGDGGGGGDPVGNAQNLNTVFGSIFRIDVDVDGNNPLESNPDLPNGRYEIPSDNPRVGRSGLDELYAWGLRNTWKFSFDNGAGRLWGGDVGQGTFEEINLIEAGGNYGWNRFEGNGTFRSATSLVTTPDRKPVYAYDHSNGDVSITLGYVYRGRLTNPAIQGKLIFGDYVSGRVWALNYNAASGESSAQLLFRTNGENVSSFGLDASGELYFSGYGQSAQLYKLVDENNPEPTNTAIDGIGSWQALTQGIAGVVEAVVVDGNTVYAAGDFSTAGSSSANNIAVYAEGQGWSALSGGANGTISALALDANGLLYAGGSFTTIGGTPANNLAVWNGSAWQALGSGTDGAVLALALDGANNLYAGGTFVTAGGATANNIARWNGSWSGLTDSGTGVAGTNNEVRSIAFDETGLLYIGGNFASAGNKTANRIATYNGSNWGTLGSGTSGFVQAIAVTDESVYIGGNFALAGGQTVNRIARWDRTSRSWKKVGQGVSGNVNALVYDGTYLYAGGNFETVAAGTNQNNIVKNIARWSPQNDEWEALGPGKQVGTNAPVNALTLAENGSDLFAGGSFGQAGATAASGIARWSATTTTDGIVDGAVYEMEPQHNTSLRLDVRGASTANSTQVLGWVRNGNANQQWKFISQGNGVYEIEPQHAPGKRLDVAGASTATNTAIHIYDRHGRANQRWQALPVGDGTYRFEPLNAPGKRLDIEDVGGNRLALSRTFDNGNSQRWRLIPVGQASSRMAEVEVASQVEEADAVANLYPNPASSELNVTAPYAYHLTLYDATGRQVLDGQYPAGITRLAVGDLPDGVYLARLQGTEREAVTSRIVIQ